VGPETGERGVDEVCEEWDGEREVEREGRDERWASNGVGL
jgi:hypothetical protein